VPATVQHPTPSLLPYAYHARVGCATKLRNYQARRKSGLKLSCVAAEAEVSTATRTLES